MDRKLKRLEEEQRRLMEQIESTNRSLGVDGCRGGRHGKNDLLEFFIGLVLLGGGLFWVFQSVRVTTSWGTMWHIGGFSMPNGVIIIPLLIGVIMLFMMRRKLFGWIVVAVGILAILLSIMNSVSFRFISKSLFEYILMFGFVAVGAALVLKALFTKH
ncbi:MAG: hypothetical protein NC320_08410 [Clostridium sp.]|nr:hypothetical protein [Clostridium sp.]MCM1547877.1 hypothetical protein [Ruminococcus sp.]